MQEASDSPERTKESIDSAPLTLKQLSDHELHLILQIESRLRDVQCSVQDSKPDRTPNYGPTSYQAPLETRYRRALLLDGARGTGKTSLLLTMAHRWTPDNASQVKRHDPEECERRIQDLRESGLASPDEELEPESPENIVVVGHILDFDPLPPAVPLIAGIVQAWRPIAERFDDEPMDSHKDTLDEENSTLLDLWHQLFRVAAVGWTDPPPAQGLIEQVLDREEQVGEWQSLDKRWKRFIDKLTRSGVRCPSDQHGLAKKTVFVVMIDDVDLQVGRIRQLLPALRMLYHQRVVFLVAADLEHMEHMLCADFLGQQNRLSQRQNETDTALTDIIQADPWSLELAQSSIEKVFARRNRWGLKKLPLLQFLAFPGRESDLPDERLAENNSRRVAADPERTNERTNARSNSEVRGNIFSDLQSVPIPEWSGSTDQTRKNAQKKERRAKVEDQRTPEPKTGTRILSFARDAKKFGLGGVMTFRTVIQLYERVQTFELRSEGKGTAVLAELISDNSRDERAVILNDESIYLPVRGQLAALHRPGPTIVGGTHSFVLSARPDFVFIPNGANSPIQMSSARGRHLNLTGLLVAKILEELKYSIDAGGLLWDTFLSHAWTEWYLGPRLAFAWTRPFHPRPEEHLEQAREWGLFVKDERAQQANEGQVEKWAYAWIYYQRKWCGHDISKLPSPGEAFPQAAGKTKTSWKELCNISPTEREQERTSKEHRWLKNTLPLLARPELGLPVAVQNELLENCDLTKEGDALRRQRRRLITDAFVAADVQRGGVGREGPKDEEIEKLIDQIDGIYAEEHDAENPWRRGVEGKTLKRRRASAST